MQNALLPVAVHAILINKQNEVLMLKRTGTGFFDDYWSLPAGRLEVGETCRDALVRETREEVGVNIDRDNLGAPLVMHHHDDRGERLYLFFICKKWQGEVINNEPDKCSHIEKFSLDSIPDNTIPHIKEALELAVNQETYAEHGFINK